MTTPASTEFEVPPPTTRPVQHLRDGGPQRLPRDRPFGPSCAATSKSALAVAGATSVGLRWASLPAALKAITRGPGGRVSRKA